MKNINIKKVMFSVFILLIIVSISTACFATIISPGQITAKPGVASNQIQSVSGKILGVAQVIGVAVAVIMLVVLAIKYLSAAPSEKAEIKKSAFIYIIGALLLFGGVALLNIIQNAGRDLQNTTGTSTSIFGYVEYK